MCRTPPASPRPARETAGDAGGGGSGGDGNEWEMGRDGGTELLRGRVSDGDWGG